MIVDVHAHFYPRAYLDLVQPEVARLSDPEGRGLRETFDFKIMRTPGMWTVDERLEIMDRLGIDAQVLSLSIPSAYEGDAPLRLRAATLANDQFARLTRDYPGRFYAFASLPLPDVEASLRELERCIDELGMVGVCLGSHAKGLRLDAEVLQPILAEIDRRALPVFLHPMTPTCYGMMEDYNIGPMLGFIWDTGVTVHRLIFSGTLERFQRLRVILPHCGGMLPFLLGRLDNTTHPACKRIPHSARHYLQAMYYDTAISNAPSLHLVAEQFGVERLLLGSDYPYNVRDIESAMETVAATRFSPEEKALILGGTARRLLGLPARSA